MSEPLCLYGSWPDDKHHPRTTFMYWAHDYFGAENSKRWSTGLDFLAALEKWTKERGGIGRLVVLSHAWAASRDGKGNRGGVVSDRFFRGFYLKSGAKDLSGAAYVSTLARLVRARKIRFVPPRRIAFIGCFAARSPFGVKLAQATGCDVYLSAGECGPVLRGGRENGVWLAMIDRKKFRPPYRYGGWVRFAAGSGHGKAVGPYLTLFGPGWRGVLKI